MRRPWIAAGALALSLALPTLSGCATTSIADEQQAAAKHQYLADRAAARGEYDRAADEQHKANDARRAASQKIREQEEGTYVPPQPAMSPRY